MTFKTVFRRDGRLIRLCRVVWNRGTVGDGRGYSCKLSLGLSPYMFYYANGREIHSLMLIVCGIRVHFQKSFGGIFT